MGVARGAGRDDSGTHRASHHYPHKRALWQLTTTTPQQRVAYKSRRYSSSPLRRETHELALPSRTLVYSPTPCLKRNYYNKNFFLSKHVNLIYLRVREQPLTFLSHPTIEAVLQSAGADPQRLHGRSAREYSPPSPPRLCQQRLTELDLITDTAALSYANMQAVDLHTRMK